MAGLDSTELADLFATVLISGVRHLQRRGLESGYEQRDEDLSSIRGRVLVADTARRMLMLHGKAHCRYDEYTINTRPNQIIRATLRHLAAVPRLNSELRKDLLLIHRELDGIDHAPLTRLSFRAVQVHSNARFYRFLLNVCEMVVSSWLIDEKSGEYRFRDFARDERRMAAVFESFVRNLISRERPDLDVRKEQINWDLGWHSDHSLPYLPRMETDISVRSAENSLIIDTKYYAEAMSTNYGQQRIRSPHLYQIFSYLKNLEARGNADARADGMLLYPAVGHSFRLDYQLGGHKVSVCSLNLSEEWHKIRAELLSLVDKTFGAVST